MSKQEQLQAELQDLFQRINEAGVSVTAHLVGQWHLEVGSLEKGVYAHHLNPVDPEDPKGSDRRFYATDMTMHPYSAPQIVEEPTFKVQFHDYDIVGFVVFNDKRKVKVDEDGNPMRFSLSNLHSQNRECSIGEDGSVTIDGKMQGCITALALANKDRIVGHIAVVEEGGAKYGDVRTVEFQGLLEAWVKS